jgi:hypothetical protein
MDAGVSYTGWLQIRLTTLRGTVQSVVGIPEQPLPFVINLQAIDGRRVALFDFTGTGTTTGNDAAPAYYEIDTGALDVSGLVDGAPIKVRGFVRPFGQAPDDFEAQTIIDVTQLKSNLVANWIPASATAIETISVEGITLNLDGVGRFHYLVRGHVAIDLVGQDNAPQIVPRGDGSGLFVIAQDGTYQLHTTFANFTTDLEQRLIAGALVKHLGTHGDYNDASVTQTTGFMVVALE